MFTPKNENNKRIPNTIIIIFFPLNDSEFDCIGLGSKVIYFG
jgi:hypothetical protein